MGTIYRVHLKNPRLHYYNNALDYCSGQGRLTPEFFTVGLPKKKVYLSGMSILSIILSLESGCHNPPPLEDRRPHRSAPSQERPLLAMSVRPVLAYAYRTSS
jgi:hypothetical protein